MTMTRIASALFAVVLGFAGTTQAAYYTCTVLANQQNVIGRMVINPIQQQVQKVYLNRNGDFAACGGIVQQPGTAAQLYCYHSDNNSQVQFARGLVAGHVVATQRNISTGTNTPFVLAATTDGAPTLQLIFPTTDLSYAILCDRQ